MDSLLSNSLAELNCLATISIGKTLTLAANYNPEDTTQILVTPYLPLSKQYKSVAYTDLINHQILLQPAQIQSFVDDNTLNPATSVTGILDLVVLHELGHFKLNKAGAFDEPKKIDHYQIGQLTPDYQLGQLTLDTEPEYLTSIKRIELAADSIAVTICRQAMKETKTGCFSVASDVILLLPGMSFQLSGKRTLNDFGQGSMNAEGLYEPKQPLLRDPNSSHPNLELRVVFMNYFLNPTSRTRQAVDELLYNREVAPIKRQESAPYIFQGQEKVLP